MGEVGAPGCEILRAHAGIAAVVEDELGTGAGGDELRGVGQLVRTHAEIKTQTYFADEADVTDEVGLEAGSARSGRSMQDAAEASDLGIPSNSPDVRGEVAGSRSARNDSSDEGRAAISDQADDVLGLLELLGGVEADFHVDGFDDVQIFGGGAVVVEREGAVERLRAGEPGQAEAREVPEMDVGVDQRHGIRERYRCGAKCRGHRDDADRSGNESTARGVAEHEL